MNRMNVRDREFLWLAIGLFLGFTIPILLDYFLNEV